MVSVMKKRRTVKRKEEEKKWEEKQEPGSDKVRKGARAGGGR